MRNDISKAIWFVLVLVLMISLILISYSGNAATAAPKSTPLKASTPNVTPKYGGTLIIRQNVPTSLGYPAKMSVFADLDAAPICLDTLISFNATGKPQPWLATSWKYGSDLKTLGLTLRKDVKFHDGTDFNAAAVKANLDLCLAAKRGELASVSSVDVVDPYTVRLNLSKIDAFLIPNLAEYVGLMVSPAALAKGEDFCRTNPVGTGPFKLVSYQSGVGAKFQKWDGYWQKGKPYLDAVQIVNIPNDMTAAASFKKGEINIMNTQDGAITKELKDVSKLGLYPMYQSIVFDSAHKDSPFSDVKVRQAVSYAVDSNALANSFGNGYWTSATQFVNKSSQHYNPNIIGYPSNLQKAKEVLATSRYPNGFKSKLIYANVSNAETVCTAVQSMLAKIGIEMTLVPVTTAAQTQLAIDGWQGALMQNQGTALEKEPGRLLQTTIAKDSVKFSSVARSAEYDIILSKLIAEPDFDKRIALNQQLAKQAIDGDCMLSFLYQSSQNYIKSTNLNDEHRGDIWGHQWLPQDAWFSDSK